MFFYGDRAPDESWERDWERDQQDQTQRDIEELNELDRLDLADREAEERFHSPAIHQTWKAFQ